MSNKVKANRTIKAKVAVKDTNMEVLENKVEKSIDKQEEVVSNVVRKRPKSMIRRGQRLFAEQREGYERRFVRDDAGRIEQFQAGGWEIVTKQAFLGVRRDDEPRRESSDIASVPAGGGSNLILMEIPKEWYDESKKEEQAEINLVEQDILHQLDAEAGSTTSGDRSTIGRVVIGEKIK